MTCTVSYAVVCVCLVIGILQPAGAVRKTVDIAITDSGDNDQRNDDDSEPDQTLGDMINGSENESNPLLLWDEPQQLTVSVPSGASISVSVILPACIKERPDGKVTLILQQTPYPDEYVGSMLISGMFQPLLQLPGMLAACVGFAVITTEGTHGSTGTFSFFGNAADNEERVANALTNKHYSNGVVVRSGISAMGIQNFLTGGIFSHPGGQWVGWAASDCRTVAFEGGALNTDTMAQIIPLVGVTAEDVSPMIVHNMYDSSFWAKRRFNDWSKVTWPTAMHAGWFDMFLEDNLKAWEGYATESDPNVREWHRLTIDPLGHCLLGALSPDLPPGNDESTKSLVYTMGIGMFVNRFMMVKCYEGTDAQASLKCWSDYAKLFRRITIFVMGSAGGFVSSFNEWPTVTPRNIYVTDGAAKNLTMDRPSGSQAISYVYDPTDPVPTIGGHYFAGNCGPRPQNNNTRRKDVLSFHGPALAEDYAITGRVTANLDVSTNATTTSFMVLLVDIYPSGEQYLVTSGMMDMSAREGWEKAPMSMTPGQPTQVTIPMKYTSWIFAKGHQIGVLIQSSSSPGLWVNPNTGSIPNPNNVLDQTAQEKVTALNSVHIGNSYVVLPEVKRSDLTQLPWAKRAFVDVVWALKDLR